MKLPKFPRRLTNGVIIYRVRNGDYDQFRVRSYDSSGRRKFQVFSDYDEAKKTAEKINDSIAQGDVDAIVLTGAQKVEYKRALEVLKPLGLSLDVAAHQLADAGKLIPGHSVLEAVRYFAKVNPAKLVRKKVADVVEQLIATKRQAGKSEDYLADIRYRCGKFAQEFRCDMVDLTPELVREFLESLALKEGRRKGQKLSGRSLNNFTRSLSTLFEFAKARGYMPQDLDLIAGVEKAEEGEGAIEIFTPKELVKLLRAASEDFLPAILIGGFAGLRAKEIERLQWSEVQLSRSFIEVKGYRRSADGQTKRVSKTAQRRLVPILPNLAKWLAPYAQRTGPIWPKSEARFEEAKRETALKAGVPWKHNALRHSFISYRLAEIQNVAQVALEAGNSPQMIFRHYRELVTPQEAKAWFSIAPASESNVISMRQAAGR